MKALVAICAVAGWAASALAHPVAQGAMELSIFADKIDLSAQVSPEEVFVANLHAAPPAASLYDAYARHADYLLRHLQLVADGQKLTGQATSFSPPQPGPRTALATYVFSYPLAHPVRELRLEQSVLNEFDYAPGNRWEASYIVRARRGAGILLDGALLTSREPLLIGYGTRPSGWRRARDYVWHGIAHILTGYDHLLFIAALALAVTTFRELFKIIAVFTIAHTLTLTLSVLDLVRLPALIVEPMIAASIVFVALQNVFWPQRSQGGARLSVAFFFGLFHGLGFAGGLLSAMSGMPGQAVSLAIFSFSLGVEIGHQVVVLPLFGLTKLVRACTRTDGDVRHPDQAGKWLLRGGSAAIAAAGIYYLIAALSQFSSR